MKSLNLVQLMGNMTRDPEIKSLQSGAKVCSCSIATNRVWKDKNTGEKKQEVEFHNLVVWGALADVFERYVKKGHPIYVSGSLQTQSWEDKETGKKMYRTEVNVRDMIMLGTKDGGESEDRTADQNGGPEPSPEIPAIDYGKSEIKVEDLPF